MKSLKQFINESYLINEAAILDVFRPEKEAKEVLNNIRTFCASMKGEKFSLDNSNKLKSLFNKFIERSSWPKSMVYKIYRNYGLATPEGFRGFFLSNHDKLEKNNIYIDWITQFDLSEIEKQYQEYKKSSNYIKGRKGEDIDPEEIEERDIIVYDRWNPDTFEVFQFTGKRTKNNEKQINMFKMDFHYDYGVKYFDCYPILSKNYFGHEDELKKRAESQMGYDNLNELD